MTGAEQRFFRTLNLMVACPCCRREVWLCATLSGCKMKNTGDHKLTLIKVFPVRPELADDPAQRLGRLLPTQGVPAR